MYVINPLNFVHQSPASLNEYLVTQKTGEPSLRIDDYNVLRALLLLPESFSASEAKMWWQRLGITSDDAETIWNFAISENLILDSEEFKRSEDGRMLSHWSCMGWGKAAQYHIATRSHPFLNMSGQKAFSNDNALMQSYAAAAEGPNVFQDFGFAEEIKLEKFSPDSPIDSILAVGGLSEHQKLSLLFDVSFGVRQHLKKTFDAEDDFLRLELLKKAVPSGGGRHPLEAFALFDANWCFKDGLYHYSVRSNALHNVSPVVPLSTLGIQQIDSSMPTFHLFLTLRLERAMWRYRESRSWRAVMFDAGHALGIAEQLARKIGYEFEIIETFNSQRVSSQLKLDYLEQPCVSVARVSVKEAQ